MFGRRIYRKTNNIICFFLLICQIVRSQIQCVIKTRKLWGHFRVWTGYWDVPVLWWWPGVCSVYTCGGWGEVDQGQDVELQVNIITCIASSPCLHVSACWLAECSNVTSLNNNLCWSCTLVILGLYTSITREVEQDGYLLFYCLHIFNIRRR